VFSSVKQSSGKQVYIQDFYGYISTFAVCTLLGFPFHGGFTLLNSRSCYTTRSGFLSPEDGFLLEGAAAAAAAGVNCA